MFHTSLFSTCSILLSHLLNVRNTYSISYHHARISSFTVRSEIIWHSYARKCKYLHENIWDVLCTQRVISARQGSRKIETSRILFYCYTDEHVVVTVMSRAPLRWLSTSSLLFTSFAWWEPLMNQFKRLVL